MNPGTKTEKIKQLDGSAVLEAIQTRWLANIIHDLSSPLFAAQGYARMALGQKDCGVSENQQRYLKAVFENLGRLAATTKELSDFPTRGWFEFEPVSLRGLIEEAVKDAGCPKIRANLPAGLLSTVGDRSKLASAVCNFVRGAVQFTGDDGFVEILAREENEKLMLQFAATRAASSVGGSVTDLSGACKVWRLHGGSVFVSHVLEESYLIGCELPVIRIAGCMEFIDASRGQPGRLGH